MANRDPANRLRRISLAVLAVYWLALFASTHVPEVPHAIVTRISDKLLHGGGFAILAFLFVWAWSSRGRLAGRQWLVVLAVLVLYGAADEVTQIPVGRNADPLDWLADVIGVIVGLSAFVAVRALRGTSI